MKLDVKALREKHKKIKTGGGDDNLFIYSNKLPEEFDIRIMPQSDPRMKGFYFIEQDVHWIDGKVYAVPTFMGGEDVIEQEVNAARESGDEELIALLDAKKKTKSGYKVPVIKAETRYLIAILDLDIKYEDDDPDNGDVIAVNVKDEMVKILVAKPSLLKAINKIVTGRFYQNGTDAGICDRVKGHNLIIGKSGTGLDTEYSSQGYPEGSEMPEKWYTDKTSINLYDFSVKGIKPDSYLRSVIRNYLYGEDIETLSTEAADDAVEKKVPAKAKATKRPSLKKKAATTKKAPATKKRSLLDDAEDGLDDLD